MDEDDYLMLSGIQHYKFCRRQWALIHLESQWNENQHTVLGELIHSTAHNSERFEKRKDILTVRNMRIKSDRLHITGYSDIVEFHRAEDGIPIFGYDGLWEIVPIEYKKGSPKTDCCDELQLCAEAICLEEMLCCSITHGFIFYDEIKHRIEVKFSDELRAEVEASFTEMNLLRARSHTPKVKMNKKCTNCSLKDLCLPKLSKIKSASMYIRGKVHEE